MNNTLVGSDTQLDAQFYVIRGETINEIKENLRVVHGDNFNELCGSNLDDLLCIGYGKYAYILIGQYHEDHLENIFDHGYNNDISAIIFADSRQQADEYLRGHPELIADIQSTLEDADDQQTVEEYLDGRSTLEIIFGDELQKIAQLSGDFRKVPDIYQNFFCEYTGYKH